MPDEDRSREQRSRARQIGILTAIPAVLLAGPLIGGFLGTLLDRWLGTRPWLLLACLALGFVAAFREVFSLIQLAGRADAPPAPPGEGRDRRPDGDGKADR